MSHTLTRNRFGQFISVSVTVVNYAAGGEPFTLAELGALGVDGAFLPTIASSQNSLGVPLFPVLDSGKVKLFQFVSGSPVEIPNTANLNASFIALIHLTGWAATTPFEV